MSSVNGFGDARMTILIQTVHKYVNNYYDADFINYYDMFGVDARLSVEEIVAFLKSNKYKTIFHPDNIHSIPEHLREYFLRICNMYIDFENIITSPHKKNEYDMQLIKNNAKSKEQNKEFNTEANYQKDDYREQKQRFYEEQKRKYIFDIFGKYLLPSLAKHGKTFTVRAVKEYLSSNYIKGFTNTQNCREKIASLNHDTLSDAIINAYGFDGVDSTSLAIVEDCMKFSAALLDDAMIETYNKHGYAQAKEAARRLMLENKYSFFTNNNYARDRLEASEINYFTMPCILAYEMELVEFLEAPKRETMNLEYIINEYANAIEERIVAQKEWTPK